MDNIIMQIYGNEQHIKTYENGQHNYTNITYINIWKWTT